MIELAVDNGPAVDVLPPDVSCGWRIGFALPPKQTVSQWADRNRYIAEGTGAEAGRWRTDRAVFQREPMDIVNEIDVHTAVLMWSSQVGKTEILINISGYYIDQDPAPQLFVMPDLGNAEGFSRVRYQRTVDATPALRLRIGPQLTRDGSNTLLEKTFPGGDIVFAGANSPASLASRPRRIIILDEIDKYKKNIGSDGSPIKQAFQRAQNYWNARRLLASTPTIEGLSEIAAWFAKSDQRYFEVPCPHCQAYQDLQWESPSPDGEGDPVPRVVWPKGEPEKAEYVCREPDCGAVWSERERHLAVKAGRWRARANFSGIAGFYLNALYSPWVSLAMLAREWEDCQGDAAEEQAFVNLKLGLPYNPSKGATTTHQELFDRKEDYGPSPDGGYVVPADVLLVTAFVDVQADRLEVTFLGWGYNDEKWVLDHRVHYCDTTDPDAWNKFDVEVLAVTFAHPSGGALGIEMIGVDAGFRQQRVLAFVLERRAAMRPFYAVKGVDGPGRPLWRKSNQPFKFGAELYLSGVDDGKSMLYRELAVRAEADRRPRVHFPRHLPIAYFEQLVAERVKIEYKAGRGVAKWHLPSGKRNEALDCMVGNMAVRASQSIDFEARRRNMAPADGKPRGLAGVAALFGRN